ncbi:MAG: cell surface protein [Bacteroidota bacterium]
MRFLIFLSASLLLSFTACQQKAKGFRLNPSEYESFLQYDHQEDLKKMEKNFDFWETKYEQDPNQYPYLQKMAAVKSEIFNMQADISDLKDAERLLTKAVIQTHSKNSAILRSLSRNYISQHRFKDALDLLEKAEEIGDKLFATHCMLFDVYLELGNTEKASMYLNLIANEQNFDYLIRMAKWQDQKGNLNTAIDFMEKALDKAERDRNGLQVRWTHSNLGDFYGHAGEIEQAYHNYRKALELNPADTYSKKGIAWIAYSYEKNPKEALRIVNILQQQSKSPDLFELKGEIAEFQGESVASKKAQAAFLTEIRRTEFGNMYNTYQIGILAEEESEVGKALLIAEQELQDRPTPQSFSLKAWTLYKSGEIDAAYQLLKEKVEGKCFEPDVLFQIAEVYKAKNENIAGLKAELLSSSFELGPLMMEKVRKL